MLAASRAIPMVLRPLSTYMVEPVTQRAIFELRKRAVLPTSSLYRSWAMGEFALE